MEKTCRTCKDSEDVSGITPRWVCKRNMGNLCGMKYKYWEPREEEIMSNNHIEPNSPPKREVTVEKQSEYYEIKKVSYHVTNLRH
jgi:nitrous oxide reductase accessory protein NosL